MIRYVLIPRFCELTGYSETAVERKIERGQWRLGKEYRIAPDGRRLIDLEGVEQWVEEGRETGSRSEEGQSALRSLQQTVRATRKRSKSTEDQSTQPQPT